jgi:DNA replication protein DnaC
MSVPESLAKLLGNIDQPSSVVAQIIASMDDEPGHDPINWEMDATRDCCRGSGYTRRDVPPGAPAFGKLFECPCGLVLGRRAAKLWSGSMIPVEYADLTLETYPDQGTADMVRRWYAGSRRPWLLLDGEYGSGKTGLAIGVLKLALADSISSVFRVVPELMSEIRATYGTDRETSEIDLLAALKAVQLLVLDDIGAERMTGWVEEKLFEILNYRHNEHRRTILTTNLGPDELMDHVGERIFWRIKAMSNRLCIEGNLRMGRS